jgi:plasmid stabilization system protein ParE
MVRRIRWTRRAHRRLAVIGSDIGMVSPAAAGRVLDRIVQAVENLREHPARGRVGRIDGKRELVFADIPYIVAYRVTPDTVDVLTILHTSRQWPDEL